MDLEPVRMRTRMWPLLTASERLDVLRVVPCRLPDFNRAHRPPPCTARLNVVGAHLAFCFRRILRILLHDASKRQATPALMC